MIKKVLIQIAIPVTFAGFINLNIAAFGNPEAAIKYQPVIWLVAIALTGIANWLLKRKS